MNRRLSTSEYKFYPKDKKVTFSNLLSGITISDIIAVYNAVDNLVIYEVGSVIHFGSLVGLDLFCSYDTTNMSSSDELEIYVNEVIALPPEQLPSEPIAYKVDVTGSSVNISNQPIVELGPSSLAALEDIEVSFAPGSGGLTNAELRATPVPVSASSLPLPTGCSTSANQATIISDLDSIDVTLDNIDTNIINVSTKIDTLAGAVSGTEVQVDIVTIPTVNISDNGGSLTVDGTVELGPTSLAALENITVVVPGTVDLGTVSLTALETITVEDGGGSLTVDANNLDIRDLAFASDKVDISGSTNVGVTGTFFQATQPVSTTSLPLPTGASTETKQDTIITHIDGIETTLGTIDADTSNISTKIDTVAGAISGAEMQVDIVSLPTVNISDNGGSITVDGPITDAQLRATPVPVSGSFTSTSDPSTLSAFGTLEIGELTPVVQSDFVYGLNTQVWNTAVVSGAGAAVDTNAGRLRVQSGTANGGYAYVTSRKIIKYRAGQGSVVRGTPVFTTGVANNVQLWGAGEISSNQPLNGYFFGFSGITFGIFHYNNSAYPTFVAQSSWNGDKVDGSGGTSFTWNKTFGTPVMIKYPYLGYGNITFWVQNSDTSAWVLVHTIKYANTTASTQLGNPSLQIISYTANTGAVANMTMYVGSVSAFISGQRSLASFPHFAASNRKTNVSTLLNILTLRTAATYNGVDNRGLISFKDISMAWEGANDTALLTMYLNPTLGGVPSYAPISGSTADNGVTITSGNSMASVDVAGTTITGGTQLWNCVFSRNSQMIVDLTNCDLFIEPNSIITFGVTGVSAAEARVAVNWVEEI